MKVISDTLERVRTTFFGEGSSRHPKNEQQTCDWVILPLIRSLGYSEFDIEAQKSSGTGGRADYVLYARQQVNDLNRTEFTWVLEAKHWGASLTEGDRLQARTYAYQLQAKVAVLTNGQIWEVLEVSNDNRVKNFIIAACTLKSDTFLSFIQCLAPDAIDSDAIRTYGNRERAADFVRSLFNNPKSSGVEWAVNEVAKLFGETLQREEVFAILRGAESISSLKPDDTVKQVTNLTSDQVEVFINRNGVNANAIFASGGRVKVLKGSSSDRIGSRAARDLYVAQREKLARSGIVRIDGDSILFLQDHVFGSPSGASDVLLGQSTNGWEHWRDRDGNPLQKYRA